MENPLQKIRTIVNKVEHFLDHYAQIYEVEHLAGPQGHVVMYLSQHPEEEIYIKSIERELKISKSVASNLVRRMEKNGFIEIVPSKEDKRIKYLQLTEFGAEKAEKFKAFLDTMKDNFMDGISEEELAIAIKVAKRIAKNIKEKGELIENV